MSTPTTQAAGTPAASAAGNIVVATSATTGSSLASTSGVTSTVTTPSSPKRTMSLGDADMEDGEEDEEISSSRRDDPSVGSRRPREDDSDASSSKRSRRGSDRPLDDAGPLSSPRSGGGDFTPPQYALYSCRGIVDDDVTKGLDFDPATDQRRDYYIGLFHELRCTNLIEQMSSSAAGGRSALPRAVGDYSSRSSFTPFGGFGDDGLRIPSPFPERPASGRSASPTYRGSEEILSNEYENDPDLGSGSDDQQFAGRSSELLPVRLAVGVEAAGRRRGSGPPDSVDRLEAVEPLQTAEFVALRQELVLLKAQIAQVSQTASNVQVDLGSRLAVLRTRVGAPEQASASSHQD
ncbi:unnamed protein product [Phytophthora fragariaefolia]|uniref:Unnamed protein product n=1 Tax=Phytophthora fragariaefolia TaxID=1490495 RepID=A0A9W7DAY8_9STRA|nr:unnamed protein product [Phytophthora fragariaefolia]